MSPLSSEGREAVTLLACASFLDAVFASSLVAMTTWSSTLAASFSARTFAFSLARRFALYSSGAAECALCR